MIIEKKINKESFEWILSGKKKYELRLNQFECNTGDILVLKEKDSKTGELTGRSISKNVTFIEKIDLKNSHWPVEEILEKGIQIISFE